MVARALLEQPLRHGFVEFHQPVLSPSLRPPHRDHLEDPLLNQFHRRQCRRCWHRSDPAVVTFPTPLISAIVAEPFATAAHPLVAAVTSRAVAIAANTATHDRPPTDR